MNLYEYQSYEEYVKAQIQANKKKLHNSYVDPNSLTYTLEYLLENYSFLPSFILCHGTRRGVEQKIIEDFYHKKDHKVDILGTEISPTASNFPNTIQWDFHEVKEEWINNTDLIYSNAFDHSIEPSRCLDSWMSCLSKKGICIIEYSPDCDSKSSRFDPFGATLEEYKELILTKYQILKVLTNENINDGGSTHKGIRYYICIRR